MQANLSGLPGGVGWNREASVDASRGFFDGINPIPFWPEQGIKYDHQGYYWGGVFFGAATGLLVDAMMFSTGFIGKNGGVACAAGPVPCVVVGIPAVSVSAGLMGGSIVSSAPQCHDSGRVRAHTW